MLGGKWRTQDCANKFKKRRILYCLFRKPVIWSRLLMDQTRKCRSHWAAGSRPNSDWNWPIIEEPSKMKPDITDQFNRQWLQTRKLAWKFPGGFMSDDGSRLLKAQCAHPSSEATRDTFANDEPYSVSLTGHDSGTCCCGCCHVGPGFDWFCYFWWFWFEPTKYRSELWLYHHLRIQRWFIQRLVDWIQTNICVICSVRNQLKGKI